MLKCVGVLLAFAVVVLCVPSASAITPPVINKQFTTNYTFVATNYATNSSSLFRGFFALDYVNGGGKFSLSGEEYIPIFLSTNFVASPDSKTQQIVGYMFEDPLCWNLGEVPKDWLILFPLQIPASATFTGNITIDNQLCSGWKWQESYAGYSVLLEMWVAYEDNAPKRINFEDVPYLNTIEWNFFGTQVGPFNPDIYAPPNLKCTNGPVLAAKPIPLAQRFMLLVAGLFV